MQRLLNYHPHEETRKIKFIETQNQIMVSISTKHGTTNNIHKEKAIDIQAFFHW